MAHLSLLACAAAWALETARGETARIETARGETTRASSRAVEILDGDTVRIDPPVDGFDVVRLAGIEAAKPPLARPSDRPWPLAARARDALAELAEHQELTLVMGGAPVDRYGRILAHAFLADGRWLQGELLKLGLARVATRSDHAQRAHAMLAIETQARADRRGLWASPAYAVLSPLKVRDHVGSFAVVEGEVLAARRIKNRIYLNFGRDWRDDFTVTIAAASLKRFSAAGLEPLALEGRKIRVRGWVERYNGPSIEATHPEQIELVEREAP